MKASLKARDQLAGDEVAVKLAWLLKQHSARATKLRITKELLLQMRDQAWLPCRETDRRSSRQIERGS
jgi:hypothetical protein